MSKNKIFFCFFLLLVLLLGGCETISSYPRDGAAGYPAGFSGETNVLTGIDAWMRENLW